MTLPTIYFCHGFNVRSPEKFFRLASIFESIGHPVVRVDYGWTGLLFAPLVSRRTAAKLAEVVAPGSIIVGHSNGAAIAYRAALAGAQASQLILINPALHRNTIFDGPMLSRVDIYHAPDDWVVRLGRVWQWLWPLQRDWGDMGRYGASNATRAIQPWVHNHDLCLILADKIGHGGAFKWWHLDSLARHMINNITRI